LTQQVETDRRNYKIRRLEKKGRSKSLFERSVNIQGLNIPLITVVIFACAIISLASIMAEPKVNAYDGSSSFIHVNIQKGDTVWALASQYASKSQDVRELVTAITKMNALNNDAAIFPGQVLKIPGASKMVCSQSSL